jgi:hypothetical protein
MVSICTILDELEEFISASTKVLVQVEAGLKQKVWAQVRPHGFGVRRQIGEDIMAQLFTYSQGLLAVPAGVATQRVNVSVDGVAQDVQLLPADATEVIFKAGDVGATVVVTLDYVDAAGNDSGNAETTFVVADTTAPVAPEGFGVLSQTGEETV